MFKKIAAGAIGLMLGVVVMLPASAHAQLITNSLKEEACAGVTLDQGDCDAQAGSSINNILKLSLNILSLVVGLIAVIMVIVSGLKYITSQGESSSVNSAKNTLLYAVVGLAIVALAQVIVRFVLNKAQQPVTPTSETGLIIPYSRHA